MPLLVWCNVFVLTTQVTKLMLKDDNINTKGMHIQRKYNIPLMMYLPLLRKVNHLEINWFSLVVQIIHDLSYYVL